jgi:DNA-binding MarR family transcriptional regulator
LVDRATCQCLAGRLRFLSRVFNGLYDDAFRDFGLRVGQFNLLVGIGALGPVRPAALAEVMHMDKSTISRDVDRLLERGWITSRAAAEGRGLELTLTDDGEALLARAMPAWEKAQAEATSRLGPDGVAALHAMASGLGFPPTP